MMWMQRLQTSKRQARRVQLPLDMLEGRQLMTVGMAPMVADVQVAVNLSAADVSVISSLTDTSSASLTGAPDQILPYIYKGTGSSSSTLPK